MTLSSINAISSRGLIGQMNPIKAPPLQMPKTGDQTIGNFGHGIQGFASIAGTNPINEASTNTSSQAFSNMLGSAIQNLQQSHATADVLAEQAATGELKDIHDYMIASTQAQISTEFAVQVRNRALESFNDIMRMQI